MPTEMMKFQSTPSLASPRSSFSFFSPLMTEANVGFSPCSHTTLPLNWNYPIQLLGTTLDQLITTDYANHDGNNNYNERVIMFPWNVAVKGNDIFGFMSTRACKGCKRGSKIKLNALKLLHPSVARVDFHLPHTAFTIEMTIMGKFWKMDGVKRRQGNL